MSDEPFLKFEEQFKAASIKKDEIGQLRGVGDFFSWFADWEFKNVLTWPFIYGMIFPLLFLELGAWVFQSVCFPIYGMQKVRRSDYFHVQRHKLRYLNVVEKLNCDYCGYANGLIAFTREIFARIEQYWCPIKHAAGIVGAHERYARFLNHGEVAGYQGKLEALRQELSEKTERTPPSKKS